MTRRVALVSVASGLVVAAVALGSAPVGAAPHRAATPSKAKILDAALRQVSVAPKSSDAWAIGTQNTKTTFSPYVVRRVGGHWSKVAVKFPGTSPQLEGVAAGSAHSVWLVGESLTKTGEHAFIMHSTGGSFKPVKVKALGPGSNLNGIAASSASNAWVIGTATTGGLVLHWNGHKWKTAKLPKGKGTIEPSQVSTSGPSNVWFLSESSGIVTVHWNGHKFSVIPVAIPKLGNVTYLATGSPKNTWLAGFVSVTKGVSTREETLTEHFNGHKWVRVSSPSPIYNSSIGSIAAEGSQAYIVGTYSPNVFTNGIVGHAFALKLVKGHWRSEHVAQKGKYTSLSSVDLSSISAQAVGTWSAAAQCTAKFKEVPLAENLSGGSWHIGSVPKFRRAGSAHLRMPPARPNRPSC